MLELFFAETVPNAITGKSAITYAIVFLGGLLTSFSPCVLSMIPVLIGYIGGYSEGSKVKGFLMSLFFVVGLATTFAILGFIASYFGRIFGQIGTGWFYVLAAVAIIMGLHLLGVLQFTLPGIKNMPVKVKGYNGSFLMGLFFGLVASPCATPVLAVIVTYAALQGEVVYGSSLLFTYGLGHGTPLLIIGAFTVMAKSLIKVKKFTQYLNYFSGSILIILGLYLLAWVSW